MRGFPAVSWLLLFVAVVPGLALAGWNAWRVRRRIGRANDGGRAGSASASSG